jgi:hypothetical protein
MCSCAERQRGWLALLLLLLAGGLTVGCANEYGCETERCDRRDNDCDGKVDESFTDALGLYTNAENCGSCGVVCSEVFPSAASTECVVNGLTASCHISACAEGERLAGDGACVAALPVACLPCGRDDDCASRSVGARCLQDALGSSRCAPRCSDAADCTQGFACQKLRDDTWRRCMPRTGACACSEATLGASFACEFRSSAAEQSCAGVQMCQADGLSVCVAALAERCNEQDDDCDGQIDEDFRDDQGRYDQAAHCGNCQTVCASQGPHLIASCEAIEDAARCTQHCEDGFVDIDGLWANGCECQRREARDALVLGDRDCDGVADPLPELIFVTPAGDDARDGSTPALSVKSIGRGLELGVQMGRGVAVARGIYAERVSLRAGVSLIGGYSPDFTQHDAELFPVMITGGSAEPGAPVLQCQDIEAPTYVADLTIAAGDSVQAGQGSTAVALWRCGSAVELHRISVLAGRGARAVRGSDSSERLASYDLDSLAQLDGAPGTAGANSGAAGGCARVVAGAGGQKFCHGEEVSGGEGGAAECAALSCRNSDGRPCGNAGCTAFTSDGVCDIAAALAAAVPNPSAQSGLGAAPGAAAQVTYDAPTSHGACTFCDDNPSLPRSGGEGAAGEAGEAGAGGPGCGGDEQLDATGRVAAGGGQPGADGRHGSGGGGGTAGAGYAVIAATSGMCSSVPGAAGGGGGSGGCGAPAAGGGGGGGSSVGVMIRLAHGQTAGPALFDWRVVTASAGDGGDGGIGAAGGAPGGGGAGGASDFWCSRHGGRGGDGGSGGDAGGGGGGCGGSSYGVYLVRDREGSAPDGYAAELAQRVSVEIAGSAGRAGQGGFAPTHAGSFGKPGQTAQVSLAVQ